MGEDDRHCVLSGERPLQEVDLGALTFFREGKDEVRVLFGGCFNGTVGGKGDDGTEGLGIVDVSEAPDCFEFFWGEGGNFGEIEVGGEGFDSCGLGDGAGG